MKATQFPKGHKPHTWKPVGTERVNADLLTYKNVLSKLAVSGQPKTPSI